MAPQLTVTKGFAARSPMPWMTRAMSSLPVPVSPSMSTGIGDLAAFCAERQDAVHRGRAGDDVGEAERAGAAVAIGADDGFELAELHGVAQRDDQALGRDGLDEEIGGAVAHRRDDGFERGMGGLDDHRHGDAVARHGFHHRHAVAVGHHQIEDHGAEAGIGAQQRQRLVAAGGGDRREAGAAGDLRGQPQLHRIVVDDEDARHRDSQAVSDARPPSQANRAVPFRSRIGVARLRGALRRRSPGPARDAKAVERRLGAGYGPPRKSRRKSYRMTDLVRAPAAPPRRGTMSSGRCRNGISTTSIRAPDSPELKRDLDWAQDRGQGVRGRLQGQARGAGEGRAGCIEAVARSEKLGDVTGRLVVVRLSALRARHAEPGEGEVPRRYRPGADGPRRPGCCSGSSSSTASTTR